MRSMHSSFAWILPRCDLSRARVIEKASLTRGQAGSPRLSGDLSDALAGLQQLQDSATELRRISLRHGSLPRESEAQESQKGETPIPLVSAGFPRDVLADGVDRAIERRGGP